MIKLKILSGKKAGTSWVARRFPVRIGRSVRSNLRAEEEGVWDEHLELHFDSSHGIVLTSQSTAMSTVNGQPTQNTILRNGDVIEAGALKLQFWFDDVQQRGLRGREWFVWALLVAVSVGQIRLIYWLLR